MAWSLLDDDLYRRLCRSRDFLGESYRQPVRFADAAAHACLSRWHFHRLYVRAFGETPHEFVSRRRLDEAKRLLATGSASVTEICYEVGYSSLGSFSSRFAARTGRSPAEFRRTVRSMVGYSGPWRILYIPCCLMEGFGAPAVEIAKSEKKIELATATLPE